MLNYSVKQVITKDLGVFYQILRQDGKPIATSFSETYAQQIVDALNWKDEEVMKGLKQMEDDNARNKR